MTTTITETPLIGDSKSEFNRKAFQAWGQLAAASVEWNLGLTTLDSAVATVLGALNAPKWVSGTSYTANVSYVTSPANGQIYMRLTTSSAGTTDPSVDTTNWTPKTVPAFPLSVVSGTTQTGVKNFHYEMTNGAASTFTLPATPSVGDCLVVGFTNGRADNVVARNGQPIMGAAENLTVDFPYFCATFQFINSTFGWRFWA